MTRLLALVLLPVLAVGCAASSGVAVRHRLAPTEAALRSLAPPTGNARCAPGNGLAQAPLCWSTSLPEPVAAARTADALRSAGARGVTARCGALGARGLLRCEVSGTLAGNPLDVAVVQQAGMPVVVGYAAPRAPRGLLTRASPVAVP
ncbi:MAG: hypothetical protein ACXVFV_03860 [Mycobacteriales bacterium]